LTTIGLTIAVKSIGCQFILMILLTTGHASNLKGFDQISGAPTSGQLRLVFCW
jgi:hypothetical protein